MTLTGRAVLTAALSAFHPDVQCPALPGGVQSQGARDARLREGGSSEIIIEEATSRRAQLHLLQNRAAKQAVWIAKPFHHLEVVVAFHNRQRHGFPCRLERAVEIAALALKLWRLERPIDEMHRRQELFIIAWGCGSVRDLVVRARRLAINGGRTGSGYLKQQSPQFSPRKG